MAKDHDKTLPLLSAGRWRWTEPRAARRIAGAEVDDPQPDCRRPSSLHKDSTTRRLLEDILADEQGHAEELKGWLAK